MTEFGDWQTPFDLAERICTLVSQRIRPSLVLEPNCGRGAFLRAATFSFPEATRLLGLDINADYVRMARSINNNALEIIHGDFFIHDWKRYLNESAGPILIIGNPPWVTNAELMRIGSLNVPKKSNINGFKGIDAITGKSNFDISEWMLIREIEALQGKDALLAMLCKTTIARKVVTYAWKKGLLFTDAEIREINAQRHFGVAVDACLMLIRFHPDSDNDNSHCHVFDSLDASEPSYKLGLRNDKLVSRVDIVDKYSKLINGNHPVFCWRSGIKHDCSNVMELKALPDGRFMNGLNVYVDIELDLLFPMLKSSDLANGKIESIHRFMLVPQRTISCNTEFIAASYPKTWKYLQSHADLLDKRKSAIYRGKPKFSIFGVGEYSFTPWKVAISGLYKSLMFRVIGPYKGKPVVFDDTCYFLAFRSEEESLLVKELLESKVCTEILDAFIFWDSKRPITKDILTLIDLQEIARFLGCEKAFGKMFAHHLTVKQTALF